MISTGIRLSETSTSFLWGVVLRLCAEGAPRLLAFSSWVFIGDISHSSAGTSPNDSSSLNSFSWQSSTTSTASAAILKVGWRRISAASKRKYGSSQDFKGASFGAADSFSFSLVSIPTFSDRRLSIFSTALRTRHVLARAQASFFLHQHSFFGPYERELSTAPLFVDFWRCSAIVRRAQ